MKEKAHRDTENRSIHELGELKSAQQLRVDEFSVQILREIMTRCRDSLHKYKSCKRVRIA